MLSTLSSRKIFLVLGDIAVLYLSLLGTVFFGFWGRFDWKTFSDHLLPFSILYFFWLIIFYIFGLYDLGSVRIRVVLYPKILGAVFCGLGLGMIFFYLVPLFGITPKTNLLLNVLIFTVLFIVWRKIFGAMFSARFLNNVAILGKDARKIEVLAREIATRPYLGYKLAVILSDSQGLAARIKENKINTLIVAEDSETDFNLLENLYQYMEEKINFLDWSQAYELFCEKIPATLLEKKWFSEGLRNGEKRFYSQVKRIQDLILAMIILVATSPLWPLIALLVKGEDGGPVIYRQERIGKNKKRFLLLKFRSMNVEAEKKSGPVWAQREDPRVTRIGKALRRIHLDELPQMLNVLRGDISLVGPRPERPEFVTQLETEIPHYQVRHFIKPGFTGWAQIKFRYGRTIMDSLEKFEYDLYYLKNRSLILDLGILLKTLQLLFKKE
jgi:exopolysaccharide biosynthesis polyprenyl glycosylphosphotransferase